MRMHNYPSLESFIVDLDGMGGLDETGDVESESVVGAIRNIFTSCRRGRYCIFAGNNYVARSIYTAAGQCNLKIGRDVFVVGTGDAPRGETFPVPLSTVWQNTVQVGYDGARILHEQITGVQEKSVRVLLPVKLQVRASSVATDNISSV